MSSYAKGKRAFGFCDRTGFRYPLRDLVRQIEDGRWNGLLVNLSTSLAAHPIEFGTPGEFQPGISNAVHQRGHYG